MKTLQNHLILFDAECPLCTVYTKGFVSTGLLEEDGRSSYQDIDETVCPFVDRQRAVDEIALVNRETGEVTYGIHSLFKIFGAAVPVLKPLFAFFPFVWLASKLYSFISFNRRIIIPADTEGDFSYQPSFKMHYRILYIFLTCFTAAFILSAYAPLIGDLLPKGGLLREYLVCGGQVIFQGMIMIIVNKSKIWDYLGNMMTISFAGSLLLLPALFLGQFFHLPAVFYLFFFLIVAGLMLAEHLRRCRLLKLGLTLSVTWVVYRIMVLFFIFITN